MQGHSDLESKGSEEVPPRIPFTTLSSFPLVPFLTALMVLESIQQSADTLVGMFAWQFSAALESLFLHLLPPRLLSLRHRIHCRGQREGLNVSSMELHDDCESTKLGVLWIYAWPQHFGQGFLEG